MRQTIATLVLLGSAAHAQAFCGEGFGYAFRQQVQQSAGVSRVPAQRTERRDYQHANIINSFNTKIDDLERKLRETESALQDREMEILKLTSEISSVRSDVDDVESKRQSLDSRVSALE
ncbi:MULTISPECIES: hypothetical protein [unclassified Ensifer]|uniref:hypothetical protein n=1 Tax=unclassified Ensifer TaxID=2633371 RepID=UPI00070D6A18|nr:MULTISPECIES: hypothetical protein [unclassified Ensifer]KQW60580.1 hypothetical protein ASD02_25700 [Ensifer sp. Root1252]KRC79408.1 hypothetical protein ASE32_26230 [Ensifer sp. Root231]KRC99801.1 hypothetical protein ASE47_26595 [Ensifer sp. Root258]